MGMCDTDFRFCSPKNGLGESCETSCRSPGQDSNEQYSPKSNTCSYDLNSAGEKGNESGSVASSNECISNNSDSSSEQIADVLLSFDENNHGSRRNKHKGTSKYREYHKEIEKRRRTRIRDTIMELADIVPTCKGLSNRLDKLTILELAAQHFRLLSKIQSNNDNKNPANVYFKELKCLIENTSGGCFIIIRCNDSRIMYASDNAKKLLPVSTLDLLGKSLLQLVLPADHDVIKQHLIQASTIIPSTTSINNEYNDESCESSQPGMKRSFNCRLIVNKLSSDNCQHVINKNEIPIPVNFTGSIRQSNHAGSDNDASYFVGICHPVDTSQNTPNPVTSIVNKQRFVSYHSADTKFIHADNSITMATGLLSQDVIGHCIYEVIHPEDHVIVANAFRHALNSSGTAKYVSEVFRMKCGSGGYLPIRLSASYLVNPVTQQLEFVILKHTIVNNDANKTEKQPMINRNATSLNFEQNNSFNLAAENDPSCGLLRNQPTDDPLSPPLATSTETSSAFMESSTIETAKRAAKTTQVP